MKNNISVKDTWAFHNSPVEEGEPHYIVRDADKKLSTKDKLVRLVLRKIIKLVYTF